MKVKIFNGYGSDASGQIERAIEAWLNDELNQQRRWAIQHITSAAASVGEADDRMTHLSVTIVFQIR
ncbi:hypothetical protein [Bosea sp. AS-1]|uniref:hypothetical protein n=1 Tax=Bosea sp. AS-1 TaxID=2015316 RepID=UPI000B78B9EB|nr:hypothetical protein [Bosea sp. AS-1]